MSKTRRRPPWPKGSVECAKKLKVGRETLLKMADRGQLGCVWVGDIAKFNRHHFEECEFFLDRVPTIEEAFGPREE